MRKIRLMGILGCLIISLTAGGCATNAGILIGHLVDSSTADYKKMDIQPIKSFYWHMPLKLILVDSTQIAGKFEGFVESDSDGIRDNRLPCRDEAIDVHFSNGSIQKFLFKSYYYQLSNNEYSAVFRLGTTGDDFRLNLRDIRSISRVSGDTVGSNSLLTAIERSDYRSMCFILESAKSTEIIPINKIQRVQLIKKKNGVMYGLLAGVITDIALFISLANSLKHME